jgi:hypothetical protein
MCDELAARVVPLAPRIVLLWTRSDLPLACCRI